jgi:hypothetical protein
MANLVVHKVVSSLPGVLAANAVYAVRAGDGFDLYITDSTGSVAHRLNGTRPEVYLTQAAYDALSPPDANTDYYIVEDP